MAKLRFLYATMGSGKSLHAISVDYNYTEKGMKTLIFTSAIDTRSGEGKIKSRAGLERNAISINKDDNILEIVKSQKELPNCVIADEIQFMEKHHMWELSDIVDELHIPVICLGLRSDYRGAIFPTTAELFVLADETEELKTVCWCGEGSRLHLKTMDGKVVKEGHQIEVGDACYHSVCRLHWKLNLFENPDKKNSK